MRERGPRASVRRIRAAATAALLVAAAAGAASPGVVLVPRSTPLTVDERLSPGELGAGQRVALDTATWLGRLRATEEWSDFRGQRVAAGEYDLCYVLQPRLKEHVGVDAHRDFAVLVPPARNEGGSHCAGDWLAASRSVTGTGHPAVLALAAAADAPALAQREPHWRLERATVGGMDLTFVTRGRARPAEEAF